MKDWEKDQYISIPRDQYEKMQRIVEERNDIDVRFSITYFGRVLDVSVLSVVHDIVSLNSNFDKSKVFKLRNMIESACLHVTTVKDGELRLLEEELDLALSAQNTWWYKLFIRFHKKPQQPVERIKRRPTL